MKYQRSLMSIAVAAVVLLSLCAVYAGTSMSAADSGSSGASAASVTASPAGLPIASGTGPSVCILNGSTSMSSL